MGGGRSLHAMLKAWRIYSLADGGNDLVSNPNISFYNNKEYFFASLRHLCIQNFVQPSEMCIGFCYHSIDEDTVTQED